MLFGNNLLFVWNYGWEMVYYKIFVYKFNNFSKSFCIYHTSYNYATCHVLPHNVLNFFQFHLFSPVLFQYLLFSSFCYSVPFISVLLHLFRCLSPLFSSIPSHSIPSRFLRIHSIASNYVIPFYSSPLCSAPCLFHLIVSFSFRSFLLCSIPFHMSVCLTVNSCKPFFLIFQGYWWL